MGISHDFRRPIFLIKSESTIGAHKSFMMNGHITRLSFACREHKYSKIILTILLTVILNN